MIAEKTKDIDNVAIEILSLVPKTETRFNQELEKFITDLVYKAPEFRNDFISWRQLEYILKSNLKELKNDWQIKIKNIMND
jgi:hypothetical protein